MLTKDIEIGQRLHHERTQRWETVFVHIYIYILHPQDLYSWHNLIHLSYSGSLAPVIGR